MVASTLDNKTASVLTEISSQGGTLALVHTQKKGVERGVKTEKKVYDDDTVQVLIWSGFEYQALVERALKRLLAMETGKQFYTELLFEVQTKHPEITLEHLCAGVQELQDSLKRSAGETSPPDGEAAGDGATDPGVWEPYVVNGMTVRGARLYVGAGDPTNPRAPKPGTVYLHGVKLGEVIIEPAPNGHWNTQSNAKTIVKNFLRRKLPIGLYVSYALEPERLLGIKVGAEASKAAKELGIPIEPEAIRQLFKIAP